MSIRNDQQKTKAQLIEELNRLRYRLEDLDCGPAPGSTVLDTEALHDEMCQQAPVALVCVSAADGRIRMGNSRAGALLGCDHDQLKGMSIFDLYADGPPGKEKARTLFKRFAAGESVESEELQMLRADGSHCWVSLSVSPVMDDQGKVRESRSIMVDITDRKKAEQQLISSESRTRTIFESVRAGVLVQAADGQITYANRVAEELFELPVDEIHEKTSADPAWQMILEDGTPVPGEVHPSMITLKTGKPLRNLIRGLFAGDPEKTRWLLINTEPVFRDGEPDPAEVIITFSNITEQKETERRLRESEERYRGYVDNAPFGIFIVSGRGKFLDVNHTGCEITGYSREELLGKSVFDLIPAAEREVAEAQFGKVLETGRSSGEMRFSPKSGPRRYCSVEAVYLSKNRILGFVTDITTRKTAEVEREHLEHQLHQSQRMETVGRLAGGIAHDFNNLLTVITGFSELLYEGLNRNDPMRSDLGEILTAAQTASTLTEQLLTFSRRQIITPRVLDLRQKMSASENMLHRLIGEDIELVFKTAEDLWPIRFDTGQLDQVLVNLAVNARDAMIKGGTLTIESGNTRLTENTVTGSGTVPAGEYVMITVSDTGSGMDQETSDRIFEPFFTTKELGKGTGLGLSTVYGILRQNHSFIRVQSTPNLGSTFSIYIARDTGEPGEKAERDEDLQLRGSESILLVEDQEMVRALAERVLKRHGYTVIAARDGGDALLTCEQYEGKIDLVLTDMVMPKMSGKALVDRLSRVKPGFRVLFMSGYTDDAIARHGIIAEGDNFLQKPFRPDELALRVRQALDK